MAWIFEFLEKKREIRIVLWGIWKVKEVAETLGEGLVNEKDEEREWRLEGTMAMASTQQTKKWESRDETCLIV